jgi:hypothetical protein
VTRRSRTSSVPCFRAHSHMTNGVQPAASNPSMLSRSRRRLRSSFGSQKLRFVAGRFDLAHPCPCQKQPCTKMAMRKRGNTISGLPGKFRACRRKRKPARKSARLTCSSGDVSRPRIAAMFRLLAALVR